MYQGGWIWRLQQLLLTLISAFISGVVWAKPLQFPPHCLAKQVSFSSRYMQLKEKRYKGESGLFLFTNRGNAPVFLARHFKSEGVSAGWSTRLLPGLWAGLSLQHNDFQMLCASDGADGFKAVSCKRVLSACRLPIAPAQADIGDGWVLENTVFKNIMPVLKKQGLAILKGKHFVKKAKAS